MKILLTICSTRVQQYHDDIVFHKRARLADNATPTAPSALEQANFARRPFNEKQLALQLTQFASDNKDFDLGSDRVENLVGTLIVSHSYPLLLVLGHDVSTETNHLMIAGRSTI